MNIAGIDLDIIWGKFVNSFDPDYGGEERFEQFNAILFAIKDKAILGYGLGSSVAESVRNVDKPWHYELTYLKLILNMGVPIFLLFVLAYLYLLYKMFMLIPEYRFLTVSILGYIIISATNPYLTNFDAMWIIFIPILFLNLLKINLHSGK